MIYPSKVSNIKTIEILCIRKDGWWILETINFISKYTYSSWGDVHWRVTQDPPTSSKRFTQSSKVKEKMKISCYMSSIEKILRVYQWFLLQGFLVFFLIKKNETFFLFLFRKNLTKWKEIHHVSLSLSKVSVLWVCVL